MENLQTEKERMLWKEAKKRVSFRYHLYTYLIINAFLWIMWLLNGNENNELPFPWPLWCTLGWGFGLLSHYMTAFVMGNKFNQVEKEFEKLKRKDS
jgi:hypothetical protein